MHLPKTEALRVAGFRLSARFCLHGRETESKSPQFGTRERESMLFSKHASERERARLQLLEDQVAMPEDWRKGCKSHRSKHIRSIRHELKKIVVPGDFVGERLPADSPFSLNHLTRVQMIRYDVWATVYEKEHWNAAVSGADYAARLLKNFKVLRLKVQWDFTQLSVPSVVETLKEFSSPSKHEELDRIKSQFVPVCGLARRTSLLPP